MEDPSDAKNFHAVLHEAVRDAELLLSYAMRHGISIDQDTSATVVASKKLLLSGEAFSYPEEENLFWQAFGKLSQNVRPVTVSSLKAGLDVHDDQSVISWLSEHIFGRRRKFSAATLAVRRFGFCVITTLILLLFIQVYWGIGSTLVKEITKNLESSEELAREEKQREKEIGQGASLDQRLGHTEAEMRTIEDVLEGDYTILKTWNSIWRFDLSYFYPSGKRTNEEQQPGPRELRFELRTAGFALAAIQFYLLPLFYGLLGALAYVLRTLTVEARSMTYTKECNIHYRLRMLLGALAGLVVVWLMKEPGEKETLGLFKTLSPFAAAFLVGYSVEILFSILDRFIAAFGQKNGPSFKNRDAD